jgi:glycosyltransferase involved in cell wall biosynthesis
MAKTTISVALCTYNGEKYLAKQLDSILSQENPVDEIVVCDDGSTDNTQSILQD